MYCGNSCGKESKTESNAASYGEKWINDLGGFVPTKDHAQFIIRGLSKTPNCFVLLKSDKNWVKGAMTVEERSQNRVAGNESTTDLEPSDPGQKPNERAGKENCHLQQSSTVSLRVVISSFSS